MKSAERNCKNDLSEGEGKLWDPNISLGKIKSVYKRGGNAPCSCHVTQNVRQ
jgi:hypothetical protein